MQLDSINAIVGASSWVTLRLFNCVCLVTSAWLAYTGKLGVTVGDVVLLTSYFDSLTTSVAQILAVLPEIGKGFESINSIGEVLECPDVEHNWGKAPVNKVRGEFTFESVSFVYPGTSRQVSALLNQFVHCHSCVELALIFLCKPKGDYLSLGKFNYQ